MEEKHIFEAYLLQTPRMLADGEPLTFRLKKASALFWYLLVVKSSSREELAALIWPDEESSIAHRHLRDILHHIRKSAPFDLIAADGRAQLCLAPGVQFSVDTDQFLQEQRADLYKGDFLKGFFLSDSVEYESWLAQTRSSFHDLYLQFLEQSAQRALEMGLPEQAEQSWRLYLHEDPLSESIAASLMSLYSSRREYNKATAVYQKLRKDLNEWLGISPLKETSRLYYAIMNEWQRASEEPESGDELFAASRRDQYRQMAAPFHNPGQMPLCSIALCGEAGVGKSYLLNYFLNRTDLHAWCSLTTACYKSRQAEPFHPWQTVMTSLYNYTQKEEIKLSGGYLNVIARLFPEFSSNLEMQHSDVYDFDLDVAFGCIAALLTQIAEKKPLLLAFEDIQWIDDISLRLLDHLMHRIPARQVLFLMTCRSLARDSVRDFLHVGQEDRLITRLDLSPFTAEETMQFIQRAGAGDFPEDSKRSIYQRTGGNAFLLVQLIRSLLEHGRPDIMPSGADEIMAYRLSGLQEEGRQLLELVAMFPDYAPYEVLLRMSGKRPDELLCLCQELRERSFLVEIDSGGSLSLAFAQSEFRELIFSSIPLLKRKINHLNIAKALTKVSYADSISAIAQAVYHFREGGDEVNAFYYSARRSRSYVLPISLLNFKKGTLCEEQTDSFLRDIAALEKELRRLYDLYPEEKKLKDAEIDLLYAKGCYGIYKGRYGPGVSAVRRLLEITERPEILDIACEQMIFYAIQIYDTELMRTFCERALELSRNTPQRYAINLRYDGFCSVMRGEYRAGEKKLRRSIVLLRQAYPAEDPDGVIQIAYAHNYLGESFRRQGLYEPAVKEYKLAIAAVQAFGGTATCTSIFYNNYALTALAQGQYDRARALFDRTEEFLPYVDEPSGYRTLSYAYRALYAFADGKDETAHDLLTRAYTYADALEGPYDLGIIAMIQAIIRTRLEEAERTYPILRDYLKEPALFYLERARTLLDGKAACPEREILDKLTKGEPVLSGLFGEVTKK